MEKIKTGEIHLLRLQMRDRIGEILPEGYKSITEREFYSAYICKDSDTKKTKGLIRIIPRVDPISMDSRAQVYYEILRIGDYKPIYPNCSLKVATLEELKEVVKPILTLMSLVKPLEDIPVTQF